MQLGQPQINFNFITTHDTKYLWIGDLSTYLFIESKPAIIQITTPGANEPIEFTWIKNNINVFNSNNLKLSCFQECPENDYIDLPDGLYKAKLIASPDTFNKERYYLKTDKLRRELNKIYVAEGLEEKAFSQVFKDWASNTEMFITVAEAMTAEGNISVAKRYYDKASNMVKNYK